MNIIFLILLIIFTVKHLIDSWNDDAKKRALTKPFPLICILLFYLTTTKNVYMPLVIALFASWLGDVLLIPKGHKWFTLGGIAFMISHFFFILVYLRNIQFSQIPWGWAILIWLIYHMISMYIMYKVKDNTPKIMVFPMYFYLLCNSTMNAFALLQHFSIQSSGSLVALIGAILFFVSDCTLFLVRYSKHPNIVFKKHFTVMLTYIVGEFLITLGMLMINH